VVAITAQQSGAVGAKALTFGFLACLSFVVPALILSSRPALSTITEHRHNHAGAE
jgi:hypothetical protein